MTQLVLPLVANRRFEIGPSMTSWRGPEGPVFLYIGAHSIDCNWPWWRPYAVRELARTQA